MASPTLYALALCWGLPGFLYVYATNKTVQRAIAPYRKAPFDVDSEAKAKGLFQLVCMAMPLVGAQYGLAPGLIGPGVAWLCIILIAYPSTMHLNPSVTICFYCVKLVPSLSAVGGKVAAQFAAAAAVGTLFAFLAPGSASPPPVPADLLSAGALEALGTALTMLLVLTAMKLCQSKVVESVVVATGAIAIGLATGTSTDPANQIAHLAHAGGESASGMAFVVHYILASWLGAATAGVIFDRTAHLVLPADGKRTVKRPGRPPSKSKSPARVPSKSPSRPVRSTSRGRSSKK